MVKAKRDDLLGPLSAVSGIIERRHTLPILSNVLMERTGEGLSFLATDIEMQIVSKGVMAGEGDSKAITVGARKLVDILRALPADAEVSLQLQDKRMVVKAGRHLVRIAVELPTRVQFGHDDLGGGPLEFVIVLDTRRDPAPVVANRN